MLCDDIKLNKHCLGSWLQKYALLFTAAPVPPPLWGFKCYTWTNSAEIRGLSTGQKLNKYRNVNRKYRNGITSGFVYFFSVHHRDWWKEPRVLEMGLVWYSLSIFDTVFIDISLIFDSVFIAMSALGVCVSYALLMHLYPRWLKGYSVKFLFMGGGDHLFSYFTM